MIGRYIFLRKARCSRRRRRVRLRRREQRALRGKMGRYDTLVNSNMTIIYVKSRRYRPSSICQLSSQMLYTYSTPLGLRANQRK